MFFDALVLLGAGKFLLFNNHPSNLPVGDAHIVSQSLCGSHLLSRISPTRGLVLLDGSGVECDGAWRLEKHLTDRGGASGGVAKLRP